MGRPRFWGILSAPPLIPLGLRGRVTLPEGEMLYNQDPKQNRCRTDTAQGRALLSLYPPAPEAIAGLSWAH